MDLLEGETLGAILHRDRRVALAQLATILLPVISALQAAHGLGIIHRDLKPENVFVCRTGSTLDVKVLDFGIAKLTAEGGLAAQTQALTDTGAMVGTAYYMSPEQVFADKDLDARSDIWSLGVIMYECLSGVRPTEADTIARVLKRIVAADIEPIATLCTDLPEDVSSLIGRMLSGDREKRPQDLSEVLEVLERHAGARPASAPGAASAPPGREADASDPRSRPTPTRIVAALALALVAIAVGTFGLRGAGEHERSTASVLAPGSDEPQAAKDGSSPPVPSASVVPRASVDSAIVANVAPPPLASSAPPLQAVGVRASTGAGSNVSPSPSATVACRADEALSNGHCCPRGLVWQLSSCERPYATTF